MKLVIFDCDGVLIDSELIACAADAETLTEAGFPMSCDDVVARFAGVPSGAMYDMIETEFGRKLPLDLATKVEERVFRKFRTDLRPIDGAADVLSSMTTRKCVASSSGPAKLALGLVETGLFDSVYPHIYSTALVPRGKPHPDLFTYSANQMGVEASECLVVEDSVAGVTAARAAGMKAIGFVGGSHCSMGHSDRLIEAGAMKVIADFRLLLREID